MLRIKFIFLSMQGEGVDTGLPTLFIRFHGCSMGCSFCDEKDPLESVGHTEHESEVVFHQVVRMINNYNRAGFKVMNVVFTGGEPLEQPTKDLIHLAQRLKKEGLRLGIETNGAQEITPKLRSLLDVISLSPKVPYDGCKVKECTNLKLIYPYISLNNDEESVKLNPEMFENIKADHRYIQPLWCEKTISMPDGLEMMHRACFQEVLKLGNGWKLGPQTHKLIKMI